LIITATVTSYLENASRNTRDFAGIAGVVTPYEL
ncbi:TPA: VapC toxin family PIN domain ribonuclease, partial [Escherichia coli]